MTRPGVGQVTARVRGPSRAPGSASTARQRPVHRRATDAGWRPHGGPPDEGRPDTERTADVADLLYVGLVIVLFAILVLAARGLERL
ncbi:hypothetical protein Acsp07_36120 [Actinomycetospora sp. NBRC 106378]|nr:hypothetical protein Acsp07_36120 [Actinomycetospora sp. NBRC 106378]